MSNAKQDKALDKQFSEMAPLGSDKHPVEAATLDNVASKADAGIHGVKVEEDGTILLAVRGMFRREVYTAGRKGGVKEPKARYRFCNGFGGKSRSVVVLLPDGSTRSLRISVDAATEAEAVTMKERAAWEADSKTATRDVVREGVGGWDY